MNTKFKKIDFKLPNEKNEYIPDGSENYSKYYNLNNTDFNKIIDEAIFIFIQVYDLPEVSSVTYTLNI